MSFSQSVVSASASVSNASRPRDKMDPSVVRRNNEDVVSECDEGDLLEFPRETGISHWAVSVGRGKVIHFVGDTVETAKVQEDRFWDVVGGSLVKINNYLDDQLNVNVLPKEVIMERARSKLGTNFGGYNAVTNNCEHFATWCRYGEKRSQQVRNVLTAGAVAGTALTASAII